MYFSTAGVHLFNENPKNSQDLQPKAPNPRISPVDQELAIYALDSVALVEQLAAVQGGPCLLHP